MGQAPSTHHSKRQDTLGYFPFASMQSEVAFFICSKNQIFGCPICFLFDKFIFECPINVPFTKFSNKINLTYQCKSNQRQGICDPLLSIFVKLTIPSQNFLRRLSNGKT